ADSRFVAALEGPAADGRVTVGFTGPLPGWRRLWSHTDAVGAPAAGVWGGPFVVQSYTPGLELALGRNESWWGRPAPHLDELRLVLVPDDVTARQLLERGELDVLMPLAATVRTPQLQALAGVAVAAAETGGWWVGLRLNPGELSGSQRRALLGTLDRAEFVGTLLRGEARLLDGLGPGADATWAGVAAGSGDARGLPAVVDLVGTWEEPMTRLLQRSMQRRAATAGSGRLELRNAEADRVEGWVAAGEYGAAIVVVADPPSPCWSCRWAGVAGDLARQADTDDPAAVAALQAKLRDDRLVVPLWRPVTVVAWRGGLNGPAANGYALNAAWNAWDWWRPR
ncbi:MAG: ABC transporter substrate-binding protein, partial [Acidimicrobiales bacterium]